MTEEIDELSGRPYEITPNGYRLATSKFITEQQECFLRSLASYRIPSLIENRYGGEQFSPIRFILRVMNALSKTWHDSPLSFQEFALFVQTSTPADCIDNIVQKIADFRIGRQNAQRKCPVI